MNTSTQPSAAGSAQRIKKVSTMILPNIQSMMTGVWKIDRSHRLLKLTYTDGSTEAVDVSAEKWAEIHDKPFQIVSFIQSMRAVKGGVS